MSVLLIIAEEQFELNKSSFIHSLDKRALKPFIDKLYISYKSSELFVSEKEEESEIDSKFS